MRRHVSDNRMILNSPSASLFRVTPSTPRAEFQTRRTGNFLFSFFFFLSSGEQLAPFTFSFVIESTLENRGKHRTGFSLSLFLFFFFVFATKSPEVGEIGTVHALIQHYYFIPPSRQIFAPVVRGEVRALIALSISRYRYSRVQTSIYVRRRDTCRLNFY